MATFEDVQEAIRIAENFVERDIHSPDKRLVYEAEETAPVMIEAQKYGRQKYKEAKEELDRNNLAISILPQAQRIVKARETRKEALEETTLLGKLLDVFAEADIGVDNRGNEEIAQNLLKSKDQWLEVVGGSDTYKHLVVDEWEGFVRSAKSADMEALCDSLKGILYTILLDLVYRELPPTPQGYKFE